MIQSSKEEANFMKFSVIIPVYNSEKYLKRCMNSVIKQTYDNWEIIAIDDGSTDNSYLILQKYKNNDKKINIVKQNNHGPGYTRNRGIELSTGDYIVFLDSDDYLEPDYFENLQSVIQNYNSDVIFIDVIQENINGKLLKYEKMSKYKNISKEKLIRYQMTGKLPWGAWRKVVKACLIKENNIIFSNDLVGEEAIFSFLVLHKANKINFLNKMCYHYVNHPNSQSKKGDFDPWGNVCKNMKWFLINNNLYDEYKKTINSFAFTSLIVSIYRISIKYKFRQALKYTYNSINEFSKNYSFDLDYCSLDARVLNLLPFVKFNLIIFLVFLSKMKFYFSLKFIN